MSARSARRRSAAARRVPSAGGVHTGFLPGETPGPYLGIDRRFAPLTPLGLIPLVELSAHANDARHAAYQDESLYTRDRLLANVP